MSKKITYALLVPCYNAENYIPGFLENISQLKKPFDEVLFYDDASVDNTYQMLLSRGLSVIKGSMNMGPGYARNRLAERSTSDYIHFHDIDDEFSSSFLSLVDQNANATSSDVILGYADWIDAVNRNIIIKWRYSEVEIQKCPLTYFISNPLGIINTVYKKDAFLNVHGFNETVKCWEDADLHIKLAAAAFSFSVIPHVLAYSIRHNNGISNNQQWCWGCRLIFIKKYLEEYSTMVEKHVFKSELNKIKVAFINMKLYNKLDNIILLNKTYQLGIQTPKINIIYYLNKVIPASLIAKAISYLTNPINN
jgi:glycosyltransferase involved in cell wall biosynthesis